MTEQQQQPITVSIRVFILTMKGKGYKPKAIKDVLVDEFKLPRKRAHKLVNKYYY